MTERYAYLGPEGTFTEAAFRALDAASAAQPLPCPTIQAALAAVRAGTADRAVVPIESSVEGVVTATLDDLTAGGDLQIQAELQLPIAFALLARPGTRLADVRTVSGHPQAQPQCRRWLASHLPGAEWVPAASNAEAARQASEGKIDAALAGAFAAATYGLDVLAHEVHDRKNAVTRFVVAARAARLPEPTGADRTTLAAFLADDHAGALTEILTEFVVRGVNLTTIQSRPTGDGLGRYYFFIDCEGHIADARVGEALMGLRRLCADVRFRAATRAATAGRHRCPAGRLTPSLPPRPSGWTACAAAAEAAAQARSPSRRLTELQVRAGGARRSRAAHFFWRQLGKARRQRPPHLLQLRSCRHLLGEQGRLDAVEQPLQPADQLRLGHAQLGLARQLVLGERQGQPVQFLDQFGREPVLELLDRAFVDLPEAGPALLVQRRRPDLFQQLADHAADPHDLGRLLDHFRNRPFRAARLLGVLGRRGALDGQAVRADHHHVGAVSEVCIHPVTHLPCVPH